MGVFVISKRDLGGYKFDFSTRRKKTIFTSIAYKQKDDCERIIVGMRENIDAFVFNRGRRGSGKFYFRLSYGGFVLATSRNFNTEFSLSKALAEVLKRVPVAEVLDFSENDFVFPEWEEVEAK